jgi:hypothetical protein
VITLRITSKNGYEANYGQIIVFKFNLLLEFLKIPKRKTKTFFKLVFIKQKMQGKETLIHL